MFNLVGFKRLLLAAVLASLFTMIEPAHAQTLTTLHSFTGGATDGGNPDAGLVRDNKGNLFGTTVNGGSYGNGTVFEVSASGKETVLHNFAGSPDGAYPYGGFLVRDAKGNLYGATYWGGAYGGGTVFALSKKGTETVLYSFGPAGSYADGQSSYGVTRDAQGNFYGATTFGGAYSPYGTVFQVTPAGNETVLYNFEGGSDGAEPQSPLIRDSKGNLYGTSFQGGYPGCGDYDGCGTVFEVTPSGKETVLHTFTGLPDDGAFPTAGLVRDSKGNFYGTTTLGGVFGYGTVFIVTKKEEAEKVLYNFKGGTSDGSGPSGGLVRDKQGNFYGTTAGGGGSGNGGFGWGTIFKMSPDGAVTVLYSFTGGEDGGNPVGNLVIDKEGNLYGTTVYGGVNGPGCWSIQTSYGCGTVFKLSQ
jgi:uncharacterized repeat protein (TIGR03803 family)